jgi:hypothetical protein
MGGCEFLETGVQVEGFEVAIADRSRTRERRLLRFYTRQ